MINPNIRNSENPDSKVPCFSMIQMTKGMKSAYDNIYQTLDY